MSTVSQPFGFAYEGIRSFCRMPMCFELDKLEADVAVAGICFDNANYSRCGSRYGPQAIREASMFMGVTYDPDKGFFDSEQGKHVLGGVRIVDCGDLTVIPSLIEETFNLAKNSIKTIRSRGAIPVILGGEHTISIPVFWALDDIEYHVVQFDSHLDLMDDLGGIKLADANPMKRAVEMDNVTGATQIGIRGYLNTEEMWEEARSNEKITTFTALDVHAKGADYIASRIPEVENIYVTLDIDALDPTEAPGSGGPEPGGLTYMQMRTMLRACAQKGKLVGMDLNEVNPVFDPMQKTANVAVRMILDLLAAANLGTGA
ncbi:MAG: arginase family protein [Candidatus Hydrogenedentota bacterium]|nr:MAG: arginase family protein [Candidatus Hydrogenedentota bacterium]